jgi:hypothetical protein
MALHTSHHKVYKTYNSNDPALTEAERNMYTTGWSRKYVGNGGADLVIVRENQSRPGKASINGPTSINKKRYKSIKAHDAAISKNTWSMWVKMYAYVYQKMYAEAMCDPLCKDYYLRWRNLGGAVIRAFIWPPPPGMVAGFGVGQWDGRQIRGPVDRLTPIEPNSRPPPPERADDNSNSSSSGSSSSSGTSSSSSGASSSLSGASSSSSGASISTDPQQRQTDNISVLSGDSSLQEQPRTMRGYNGEIEPALVIPVEDYGSGSYQDMGDVVSVESSRVEERAVQSIQPPTEPILQQVQVVTPPPPQPTPQSRNRSTSTLSEAIINEFRRLAKKLLGRPSLTREKRSQKSPSLQAMCSLLEITLDPNNSLAVFEAAMTPFIKATYVSFLIEINSFYDIYRWEKMSNNLFENLKIIVAKLDIDVPYNSSEEEDLIDKCILWGHSSDSPEKLFKKLACLFAPQVENAILKIQTPIYFPSNWTSQQYEVLDGIYQLSYISEPRNVDRGRMNIIRNRVGVRLAAKFYQYWKENQPNNGRVVSISVNSVEAATPDDLRKLNVAVSVTQANEVFVEIFKDVKNLVFITTPLKVLDMIIHTTNTPLINLTFEILVGTKPPAKPLPSRKRKQSPK